ncbi:MAG TPA: penicillin acylase family protein [Acidimicrobiales bacterium]|nr:penicillin acylase family protein [Acidimicrobiales bacterium]
MSRNSIIESDSYEAEIRWTTHGVPHIRASDWGSLGFGQGYACAQHHFATIADQVCKVRSQRARFLGRGSNDVHLNSDIGYRVLGLHARAQQAFHRQPENSFQLVSGFAAGLNAWLQAEGGPGLPHWCEGAPWIGPIEPVDIFAYAADLSLAASSRNLIEYIALAQPPGPDGPAPTPPLGMMGGALASNGWGVGSECSRSGNGIIVANPHFPWYGEARFWECHLTIPGTLDVYGVALVGTPGIQIGFNRDVAWTHTFSVGKRFTLYRLELVPGDPTRYLVDGEARDMTEGSCSVEALGPNGEMEEVARPVWRSHIGPMLNLPMFGWSEGFGFTYRDANEDCDHFITQWLGMATANGLDGFRDVFEKENGLPWVTTVATDKSGRVWFIDASHTANLSAEAIDRFTEQLATDPITNLLFENRVALLDGSDSSSYWIENSSAPSAGLLPLSSLPQMERRDWISNCNDSHWLSNPYQPLEGFSPLVGVERSDPAPRTRANFAALGHPPASVDGLFDANQLEARLFSNSSILADTLCAEVVKRLQASPEVVVGGRVIDLSIAAATLDKWDRKYDLDSRGAVLWREAMAGFADEALKSVGPLFAVPFCLDDPLGTPNTLSIPAEGDIDPIVEAVGRAIIALEEAGISIDAPLGQVQWVRRGDERVPVHGGQEVDGVANILAPVGLLPATSLEPITPKNNPIAGRTERTGLREGGYEVTYGTSFIMVVEMFPEGPKARGLLAYGQSEDPCSPHFSDQIGCFAAKQLRPLLFENAEIDSDPAFRRETIRSDNKKKPLGL